MLTGSNRRNIASCLDSNARWRRQARNLRDASKQAHLQPEQHASLQAEWWLNGAIEDE